MEWAEQFKEVRTPYSLTDTTLLNNKDTVSITSFLSDELDSTSRIVFGKAAAKYNALGQLRISKTETFLFVKAAAGNKKAAFIVVLHGNKISSVWPFLIPDQDKLSTQVSSIDKSYSIVKTISRKDVNDVMVDRKEVYSYNIAGKKFDLILTDLFDDTNVELLNPIDSFSMKHKFSGDYFLDKRNLVSIRDGYNLNQLMLFVHLEKNKGQCTGELKGEILVTTNTTAVFRGDQCVIDLKFSSSGVVLKEKGGCGAERGMDCVFDGTYLIKKKIKSNSFVSKK